MMYPKKSTLNQMEQSPSNGGRDLWKFSIMKR